MRLVDQSTRATIRTLTIVAAAMSLLLTLITPFVGTAWGDHADPYNATNGVLDSTPTMTLVTDACGSTNEDDQAKGGTKLDTIHQDSPPVIVESSVTPKDDFCKFWVDSHVDDTGDVWLYAAFERATTGGTAHVAIELLNEAADCDVKDYANCNPWENRDAGTRIIGFTWQGNDGLTHPTLWTYDNGFDAGNPLGDAFTGSTDPTGKFGEIAVNLSDAGEPPILPNVNDATECELIAAVIPLSMPGLSLNSQPKDVVLANVPPIQNCGSLKVVKSVTGGDDFGAEFPITVGGIGTSDHDADDLSDGLGHGDSFTVDGLLKRADYTVTEDLSGLTGWSIDSIVCKDQAGTTVASSDEGTTTLNGIPVKVNETTTCTVTNTPDPPTLTLLKEVVNQHGGTLEFDDFSPTVEDADENDFSIDFQDVDEVEPDATAVDPGTYTIGEDPPSGYVLKSITCVDKDGAVASSEGADVTFSLSLGDHVTCTFVNEDLPAGLTLIKLTENRWGGDLEGDSFTLKATPIDPAELPDNIVPIGDAIEIDSGDTESLGAGTYLITEEQESGYEFVSLTCDEGVDHTLVNDGTAATVTVDNDTTASCTFTNRDIPGSLTINKVVSGGTATQDDFTPSLALDDEALDDIGWGAQSQPATTLPEDHDQDGVQWGTYAVGEDVSNMPTGYSLTSIVCSDADQTVLDANDIEIGAGDDVTCVITNTFTPPPPPPPPPPANPTLTLIKTVDNTNGGTLEADDFDVFINDDEAAWGVTTTIPVGDHMVSEGQQPGYLAGDWGGDCAADGSLTAEAATDYTCTITNTALPAGLTIVKDVLIGDLEPADFALLITDGDGVTQTVSSGQVTSLPAGTYTIGEEQQDGYELVSISCDNGVEAAEGEDTVTVTVGLDETVVCTIVNAEIAVLPIVVEPEPEPAPVVEPVVDELPATGLDTMRLALVAALIAALGVMFLLGTSPAPATGRRRRD